MKILVSGSSRTVARIADDWPDHLGFLLTPRAGNRVETMLKTGLPWAADNSAFAGFDADRYRAFLPRIASKPGCLFVAVPDVVGHARKTLDRWEEWRDECRLTCHPLAFVGQDGIEDLEPPWEEFQAWFIGGSTRWKLSQASADLAWEAKQRGKWLHMGRVNSRRRLQAAMDMGCDSVDGSSLSMFGDHYIAKFCCWARQLEAERTLFN